MSTWNEAKHVAHLTLINGLSVFCVVCSTILALRVFGATIYGQIVVLQATTLTICTFLIPPSNFLIQGHGDRAGSNPTYNLQGNGHLERCIFWITVDHYLLVFVVFVSTYICIEFIHSDFSVAAVLLITAGTTLNYLTACTGFLRTIDAHSAIAWVQFSQAIFRLGLLTLFGLGLGFEYYWVYFLPDLFKHMALLFSARLMKEMRFQIRLLDSMTSKSDLKELAWLICIKISDLPIQAIDRIFVGTYIGDSAVAYIHVARRSWIIFSLVPETIHQKYLTKILQINNSVEIKLIKNIAKFSFSYLVLGFLACATIINLSYIWGEWLFDNNSQNDYMSTFTSMLLIGVFSSSTVLIHPLFVAVCGAKKSLYVLLTVNFMYLIGLFAIVKSIDQFVLILAAQGVVLVTVKIYIMVRKLKKRPLF